jgi:RND family efflux transporter MFP subunit
MKAFFTRHKNWLLPVGVLTIAYGIASIIRNTGPELEVITPEPQSMVVRSVIAQPQQIQLTVRSQGEVDAQHMIDLVSELPGKVRAVAPAFVTGGYFTTGDVLLELDPTDFELARIRAQAAVAEANEELEIEKTEAELASQGLFPLREAKVASADARLQSAQAELAQAEADLQRTRVKAPFDGRILFTQVDLGQYVSMGQTLGRIFSTGVAEIRLPLTDQQLRYLDRPFGAGRNDQPLNTPVTLSAEVGGQLAKWQGRLVRMDGAVDVDNRVWYAVAHVDDPYGLLDPAQETPLVVGLFVEAEITGRTVQNVFRLPRSALRNQNEMLIVDDSNRLRLRSVAVLQTDFDSVYIDEGLRAGERICISPVETFIDGLLVEAVDETRPADQLATVE